MPRILKAATVFIDRENKVQIKADIIPPLPETAGAPDLSDSPDLPEISPEELAEDIVKKAEDEANVIILRAEMDAAAILKKARDEAAVFKADSEARAAEDAQRIREESYQEAYQKGVDEATAVGDSIKAEAQSVLQAAIQEKEETLLAIEPDAVNLIIDIVDKLLGAAVKVNPAVVVSLIRQGFAGATLSGQISIRVSEADYEQTSIYKEELMAAVGGTVEPEIVKDLSLGPTECIIDTPFGGIDVSLRPQFEALRENLIFLLEHP